MRLSTTSKAEFLAELDRLTAEVAAIESDELILGFQSVREGDFTMPECKKIVHFALDQIGIWQGRWLFSSAATPDAKAEAETEGWERVWEVFAAELIKNVPSVEVTLRKTKDLVLAQRMLERKLEQDRGSRVAAVKATMLGSLARVLNRIGFKSAALRIYSNALYPPGTVGRGQG